MRSRVAASHSWQLAGAAATLAVLSCVTLVAHSRRPAAASELVMRVPNSQKLLWLGDYGYIDGLEDDGQFMVPSTPADESSGNALFDFGNGNGVPLSKSSGEPVPGLLPAKYWQKTGTSEEHFPNDINQFDIEGIRELEDGIVPWYEREDYYDDTYPKYRMDMGFITGPEVSVEDGHVTGIEENVMHFFNSNDPYAGGD